MEYSTLNHINRLIKLMKEEGSSAGDVSDGNHTFTELYNHRMYLFAVICGYNKDISWKSWYHSDGTYIKNFFIVGIETPEGQYTYHYPKAFWEVFDVKELEKAPNYDGHSSKDIKRLFSLLK